MFSQDSSWLVSGTCQDVDGDAVASSMLPEDRLCLDRRVAVAASVLRSMFGRRPSKQRRPSRLLIALSSLRSHAGIRRRRYPSLPRSSSYKAHWQHSCVHGAPASPMCTCGPCAPAFGRETTRWCSPTSSEVGVSRRSGASSTAASRGYCHKLSAARACCPQSCCMADLIRSSFLLTPRGIADFNGFAHVVVEGSAEALLTEDSPDGALVGKVACGAPAASGRDSDRGAHCVRCSLDVVLPAIRLSLVAAPPEFEVLVGHFGCVAPGGRGRHRLSERLQGGRAFGVSGRVLLAAL